MLTTLKTTLLAGMIGLAALPAQAESLYLGFGDNDDARFGVYLGDNGRAYRDDDDWRRDEWRESRRRCSPERALDKARDMGIRRARIDYVGARRIGVVGRQHGDRVSVTFARTRGCPVIGY